MDEPQLQIGLLGQFRVTVEGCELQIAARKQRMLLAELALRRGRAVAREDLLLALWPDSDEQHARDSLRHALWRLRSQLGPAADAIRSRSTDIALDERVAVDVVQFERLAASDEIDDLRAALDFYRGDLCRELEGEQAEVERERLRRVFVAAGIRLAGSELKAGHPTAAAEIARQILHHDPYREDVHRLLLEALAAAGDPAGVAAHYRRLTRLLREELGVEPSPETRALYLRLARGTEPVPPGSSMRQPQAEPPASLIGRGEEFRRLIEALTDAIDGRGRVVQVSGEAGAGKTRLLQEVGRTAAEHGLRVLAGHGVGVEGQLGYQIWVDALGPVAGEAAEMPSPWPGVLASLLPDLSQVVVVEPGLVAPELARARLFEGISRLLAHLATRLPVLVILDDLHWADADALHLLHYLARTLRDTRVTIVTAARPVSRDVNPVLVEVMANLQMTGLLSRIELGPLDLTSVARLLEQAGLEPETASRLAPRITDWTRGNPLFVLEATRALVEQGSLHAGEGGRLAAVDDRHGPVDRLPLQLPRNVRETILARVDVLPEATRPLLNVASAVGPVFAPDLLSAVSGRDEMTILDALTPAMNAGLLRETVTDNRPALAFNHDLVREAIYQQQPSIMRAAIHRRIAATLEVQDAPSATIAHHLTAAGEVDRAVDHWLAAGEAAESSFAYEEAVRVYGATLAMIPERDAERRAAILERLGTAHLRRGTIADAISSYDQALSLLSVRDDVAWSARLKARLALSCGRHYARHPQAREYAGDAVTYYQTHGASPELCEALIGLAYMQYQQLEAAAAEQTALDALDLSRRLGLPRYESAAIHVLTWARWLRGAPVMSQELHEVDDLIARLGRDEEAAYLQYVVAISSVHRGDFYLAEQQCRDAADLARRVGSLRAELLALETLSVVCAYLGRPVEAIQAAEQALGIAGRLMPDREGLSVIVTRSLAVAHALNGNNAQALTLAERLLVLANAADRPGRPIHLSARLEAWRVFFLLGRPDLVPDWAALLADRPVCKTCDLEWLVVAGQRAAWCDDPNRALALAQLLGERAEATGAGGLYRGWDAYIASIALRCLGRLDEARRRARESLDAFQAIDHAWGLALLKREWNIPSDSS